MSAPAAGSALDPAHEERRSWSCKPSTRSSSRWTHNVEATAAQAGGDRQAVDATLERASKLAGRLLDAVGGCESMGTAVGEQAMELWDLIERIDLDDGDEAVFRSLCRAIGLLITVGRTANGPTLSSMCPVPRRSTVTPSFRSPPPAQHRPA